MPPDLWPGGAHAAAVLSFDIDAQASWLARDPKNAERPVTMSIGNFGPTVGVPHIVRMLRELSLPATFFVPAWTAENHPRALELVCEGGFEVALHGDVHEPPDRLSRERELEVLERSIDVLTRMTGKRPVGYRSPSWELSAHTLPMLEEHGVIYSSDLMDDYYPYIHRNPMKGPAPSFTPNVGGGLVELPVQWMLDDAPFFMYGTNQFPGFAPFRPIQPNDGVLALWKQEFGAIYRQGGVFVLTCHPQISGRPSRVEMLRSLAHFMRGFPNVWFATCQQVAEHFLSWTRQKGGDAGVGPGWWIDRSL